MIISPWRRKYLRNELENEYRYLKKYKYEKINLFERILIVLTGYLILPATISLPYYLNIENLGLINCYFEAISGFTSTGFTIFNAVSYTHLRAHET